MKRFSTVISTLLLVLYIFIPETASANFMVYPMSTSVSAGKDSLVKIFSKSSENQYVRVTVKKIINPGSASEREEVVPSWQEDNLIVSPAKIIIPAGGSKAIRLTQITPPAAETLYRVYFEGVKPESALKTIESAGKNTQASLSLNVVFAALVRVLPEKERVSLQVSRSGNALRLINNGNVRAGITGLSVCPDNINKSACTEINFKKYIYPQGVESIDIKNRRSASALVKIKKENGDVETRSFSF